MFTKRFAVSLIERAIKTFAQSLIALWPLGDAAFGLLDVDWRKAASIAGMAALLSALSSIVSAPVGPDGSPSLVGEPPKEPKELLDDTPPQVVDDDGTPTEHALDGTPGEIPASQFLPPPSATRYDGPR